MSAALSAWRRLVSWPCGQWLFSRLICFKAPYFATIAPRFLVLEPGRCEIRIRDRRRVHNHIGTVHAIALCNLAELSGGTMTDISIPSSMRWIPKGMSVEYLAKAVGAMHAVATPERAAVESTEGYEWPVAISVRDAGGQEVFRARISMWVSPRSRR
ncbi:Acyl-coenzyme A thioesterase PaaI, contains HGG motif [Dyella sp. OK004]|uniref:hotdog fold domain-containing protein n=1 Tax=Dyella sp. OK004 TaxID=1855292 RepID=UPI0008EE820D|nr:hotdog fold domain-containing protein [Dyella sp. OK004]SFS07569.1 Acyl-coenzyme A thioesterase PaaI, contains HGG motif [Dyella sp. OK004]